MTLLRLMVSFLIIIGLSSPAFGAPEWNNYQIVPITQCELESGIVNLHVAAQTGPGTALYYPDANTIRILWTSDDIPSYGINDYDIYYVDYDRTTGLFSIARDIDLICADSINTGGQDQDPSISEDGQYLFFLREGSSGHEIWVADLNESGLWENPRRLPSVINAGDDEHAGCMRDGQFYWTANNRDGTGTGFDIWRADVDMTTESFTNIVKIEFPAPWNNNVGEVDPFVTSDGKYMYLRTTGDIYVSKWSDLGGYMRWGVPVALGPAINDAYNNATADVSIDNKFIFFCKVAGDPLANRLCYADSVGSVVVVPDFELIARDVPMDQGGKIHLQWNAFYLDVVPHEDITHYSTWRRIDMLTSIPSGAIEMSSSVDIPIDFDGEAVRRPDLADGYAWEWLANVPARYFETYALLVTSLYDSLGSDLNLQYFMVTAHTDSPLEFYDSEIAEGYSVDNLAPAAPAQLAGTQQESPAGIRLAWQPNTEADFSHYNVYRNYGSDFEPGPANLLTTITAEYAVDGTWTPGTEIFYRVAAVDVHRNIGPSSLLRPEEVVVGTTLQAYAAVFEGEYVMVTWTLAEVGETMKFHILRAEGASGPFTALENIQIVDAGMNFSFTDPSTLPGRSFRYRVDVTDEDGTKILFETELIDIPGKVLTLDQNHPNPFNPSTSVSYYLPASADVRLEIYDVSGRRVATLAEGFQTPGPKTVRWNGTSEGGDMVSSGVYFCRLTAGKKTLTRKMILLR
ncbi:MAG: T9SS type A sorting domain-containing protein [Candidatus Krumholzibacteria bacterium]|nr:T9SS type A sorting domain-containing protein [Candidatus Krumholzibacteria bacterium]